MKQNLYSFSLFFWIHITFQYLRIVEGKRFELYLSLTGFRFFRFLSLLFTGDWPSWSRLNSACCSNAGFCPNWRSSFSRVMAFLARRACGPIIRLFLFHHLAGSRHLIDLDFFRSTDFRAQSADSFPLLFPTILTVSLNACWFK